MMEMRAEEDALLEQARLALGAKHVIRVCAVSDQAPVLAAVRRLVEAAPRIAAAIDLSDTSIAIDDCYDGEGGTRRAVTLCVCWGGTGRQLARPAVAVTDLRLLVRDRTAAWSPLGRILCMSPRMCASLTPTSRRPRRSVGVWFHLHSVRL